MSDAERVLQGLLRIRARGPRWPSLGLGANLEGELQTEDESVRKAGRRLMARARAVGTEEPEEVAGWEGSVGFRRALGVALREAEREAHSDEMARWVGRMAGWVASVVLVVLVIDWVAR